MNLTNIKNEAQPSPSVMKARLRFVRMDVEIYCCEGQRYIKLSCHRLRVKLYKYVYGE